MSIYSLPDSIRDITEDKKLASTGEFNGSGKYVRVETRQQFEDYKLSFENFILEETISLAHSFRISVILSSEAMI